MSVTLRKRKNKNGTTSLILDIYHNGERKYEFLKSLQLVNSSTPLNRDRNQKNLELAKKIAIKKAQDLSASDYDMVTDTGKKTLITEWMQSYVDKYDKKDIRHMRAVLNRLKDFLKLEKKTALTFGQLSEVLIEDFQDYLIKHGIGEGPSGYFARFKKMMKRAYKQKLMSRNVAADVPTKKSSAAKKDSLSIEEIQLLSKTPTESSEVKRAFLFCTVTALRWVDVHSLTWKNIRNNILVISQTKTGLDLHINLNDTAIQLIGQPKKPNEKVFDLPTPNGANKTVKAWVKRAGIDKKITWHNARHSAGVNLALFDESLLTIAAILGHSSTKHTQRYARAAKEIKQRATDKLNFQL